MRRCSTTVRKYRPFYLHPGARSLHHILHFNLRSSFFRISSSYKCQAAVTSSRIIKSQNARHPMPTITCPSLPYPQPYRYPRSLSVRTPHQTPYLYLYSLRCACANPHTTTQRTAASLLSLSANVIRDTTPSYGIGHLTCSLTRWHVYGRGSVHIGRKEKMDGVD